jgi:hypothetical protein
MVDADNDGGCAVVAVVAVVEEEADSGCVDDVDDVVDDDGDASARTSELSCSAIRCATRVYSHARQRGEQRRDDKHCTYNNITSTSNRHSKRINNKKRSSRSRQCER